MDPAMAPTPSPIRDAWPHVAACSRAAAFPVLVAVAGACSLLPLYALGRSTATAVAGAAHMVALLVAAVLMLRTARRGDAAMRRPRLLFVASLLASATGALVALGYVARNGSVPVPSVVDLVAPLWVPLAAWGFWSVPTRVGQLRSMSRLVTDGAVAAAALLLVSWILVIEPLLDSGRGRGAAEAVQLVYPVSDVVITAVVLSLLPRARADLRPFLNRVAFGLLLISVSDSGFTSMVATQGEVRFGWPDLAAQAGLVVLVHASVVRRPPVLDQRPLVSHLDWALPLVPVLLAVGISLWHVVQIGRIELAECLFAAAMVLAILARQVIFTVDLARVAERHRYAAGHDGLTGLPNRTSFLAQLSEHLSTPGSPDAVVLLLDLDGFKDVNDTLGHEAGDDVLLRFADALRAHVGGGVAARLGGDEFAVLVPSPSRSAAASAVADELAAIRIDTASGTQVSCSVGQTSLLRSDTAGEALRRADLAMYAAKQRTQRVAVFTPLMSEHAERRTTLLAQLGGAVERGEMSLVYQPIYRLADGTVSGAEALLRWTSPQLGPVAPDEFIPLAEDSGDIVDIGRWVLQTALEQVAAWERTGHVLPQLFVNAAASQFDDALVGHIMSVLARTGIAPGRLTVEITETQVPGLALNSSIGCLRAAGVHVAIDDFGSGYSSLAQIARLPVDVLKIDRDFIRNLDDSSGRPILDMIVGLAGALGLETIAEGIEDITQAAEVSNAGVHHAQGYLFSRPVPPDALFGGTPVVPPPRRGGLAAAPVVGRR